MEPRHLIRAAIAASVLGHLALAAGVYFADARPMEAPDESVSVDLVTPQELAEVQKKADEAKPEPEPEKLPEPAKPEFRLPDLTTRPTLEEQKTPADTAAKPQASPQKSEPQSAARQQQAAPSPPQQQSQPQSQQPPSPPPQQQAQAPSSPPPSSPPPAAQPPRQQQAALQSPALQSPPPAAEQAPPQTDPDITVKYGVILGLPGFGGAPASEQADVAKTDIAAFHRHLKTCLKLPADVARNDDAMVKLRAMLSPDGRLVAEPTVIEVRRPAKAALLLQAAKHALEACQPYSMLPADKYNEWKVLDLPFTPQDFGT